MSIACALCGRETDDLTDHHLIPKTTHSNKRIRKLFTREERCKKVPFCGACHRVVHATFKEKELALQCNTVQKLLDHPKISRFVGWVRTRPDSGKIKVKRDKPWQQVR